MNKPGSEEHSAETSEASSLTERERVVRFVASSEAWRVRLRRPFHVSPERIVSQASVGLASAPDMTSRSGAALLKLQSYIDFRKLARVVDIVATVQSSTGSEPFAFREGSTWSGRGSTRPLKPCRTAREFAMAALESVSADFRLSFPVWKVHPYVDVLKSVATRMNVDRASIAAWRMTADQVGRMNEGIDWVRTSSRALSEADRQVMVHLRESARKNAKDFTAFLQRLSTQDDQFACRCFTAGHMGFVPAGPHRGRLDFAELATAIDALEMKLASFVKELKAQYRVAPFLRPAGLFWKLEACWELGARFLFAVLLPLRHPLLPVLDEVVRSAWLLSATHGAFLEPLGIGLVSSPTVTSASFQELSNRLIARFIEVDRYAKLDLRAIEEGSRSALSMRKTCGKVVLLPS